MRYGLFFNAVVVGIAAMFVVNRASGATYNLDANLDPFQEVPRTTRQATARPILRLITLPARQRSRWHRCVRRSSRRRYHRPHRRCRRRRQRTDHHYADARYARQHLGNLQRRRVAHPYPDHRHAQRNTYINITDSVFPSGEIRGQILAVPEPGSFAVLIATASSPWPAAAPNRRALSGLP